MCASYLRRAIFRATGPSLIFLNRAIVSKWLMPWTGSLLIARISSPNYSIIIVNIVRYVRIWLGFNKISMCRPYIIKYATFHYALIENDSHSKLTAMREKQLKTLMKALELPPSLSNCLIKLPTYSLTRSKHLSSTLY